MNVALRSLGIALPMVATRFVPDIQGELALWWLLVVSFVLGVLLRTWWSTLLVSGAFLGFWLFSNLVRTGGVSLSGDDFSVVAGIGVLLTVLGYAAASAAAGSWISKLVEQRIEADSHW